MQEDALQRDLPAPDEAYARHHYLRQGVEAPDLATIKDFFHFFIATSCGKIVTKLTVDSIAEKQGYEWVRQFYGTLAVPFLMVLPVF